ncbi:hypothetical protein RF11_00128 [Thelohanellus kitauei]|uniref:Uncharacterized protein n=1 Tax=Thelohanellus kitauei TaxID=669202 RepID=A0A0C2MSS0_THEKT|nr:hypothetical protein RF11_00128 [Thelohanellus kitauei]
MLNISFFISVDAVIFYVHKYFSIELPLLVVIDTVYIYECSIQFSPLCVVFLSKRLQSFKRSLHLLVECTESSPRTFKELYKEKVFYILCTDERPLFECQNESEFILNNYSALALFIKLKENDCSVARKSSYFYILTFPLNPS